MASDKPLKFFDGEDVEGVSLVVDPNQLRRLQSNYNLKHRPFIFKANWPVSLTKENISQLKPDQYVVAPKPHGTRFLLHVDSFGNIYMENMKHNLYQLDAKRINSIPADTVIDGYLTRNISKGRLTFVIHDAIRYNGYDLTNYGIIERIKHVKVFDVSYILMINIVLY